MPNVLCDKQCGVPRDSPHFRILGGIPVRKGYYPWIAYLEIKKPGTTTNICGGSIVDSQWILTAAHCFIDPSDEWEVSVTLGEYDTAKHEGTEVYAGAEEIVIHKDFDTKAYDNDITLIRINVTLDFDGIHKHLAPACLPQPNAPEITGCTCIVSGWGNTVKGREAEGQLSPVLREVEVKVHERSRCSKSWDGDYDTKKHICAGSKKHDFCGGDSGGPLVCEAKGRFTQYGLVSYGAAELCGSTHPGTYTRLVHYLPWIKTVLGHEI